MYPLKVYYQMRFDRYIHACNHHPNQGTKHFCYPWKFPCALPKESHPPSTPTDLISITRDYLSPVLKLPINGIIQFVLFCVWHAHGLICSTNSLAQCSCQLPPHIPSSVEKAREKGMPGVP